MKNTIITLALGALAANISHAALVANWDFNNANDSVSSTAGTLVGGASLSGGNLSLTGTGGFDSNTAGGLGGTGSFTVVSSFTTATVGDQTIFSYSPAGGSIGGRDLRLFVQSTGDLRIEMSVGAGFTLNLGAINLNDGNLHKIAAVFDSSVGNSFYDVDLYVDGTMYNVTTGTDHAVNLATTASGGGVAEVSVGYQLHTTANRVFNGNINYVQIHNTALTAAQINAIPEPGAALLGGLGILGLLRRRRA